MERNEAAWLHQTLRLELEPGKWFEFRTLSFYDVYLLWPHLFAMGKAIQEQNLISWADHLPKVVRVLNPILYANERAMKRITPTIASTVIAFYRAQDWERIRLLGEALTPEDEEKKTPEELEKERAEIDKRFLLICAAAAREIGMDVERFMQQRFELCADAVMIFRDQMHKRAEAAGIEDGTAAGKLPPGTLLQVLSSMLPAEKYAEEQKPAWMKEIEKIADEDQRKKRASKPS